MGKPVIVTNNGGNAELVQHNKSGYLVSNNYDNQVVQNMETLLSDSEKARKMGEAGRQIILENFSLKEMVINYINLYRKLSN